jgi:hypothetical protein
MRKTTNYDLRGYNFANGMDLKKDIPWLLHLPSPEMDISEEHLKTFFDIMKERQKIWVRRTLLKKPAPWTNNAILRDYKYTNVYRELDRASQFVIKHILTQEDLPIEEKLFKLMIFRFYNQPDSFRQNGGLIDLPDYSTWGTAGGDTRLWRQTVAQRKRSNPWHTAYMMNMAFAPKLDKPWTNPGLYKDWAYIFIVFDKIYEIIPGLVTVLDQAKKPEDIIECLETIPAVSTFQSHEFFIDFTYFTRYSPEGAIMNFDANDFTNVGPGAALGIRLIFPSMQPKEQKEGLYYLHELAQEYLGEDFPYLAWNADKNEYYTTNEYNRNNFTLHQIEMWLCEFSKYWKMNIGAGKQRSKFQPSKN